MVKIRINLDVNFTSWEEKPKEYSNKDDFNNYLGMCTYAFPMYHKLVERYGRKKAIECLPKIFNEFLEGLEKQ